MSRSFHSFECENEKLFGSLDSGSENTGLLIVSGGNEIRSGAHAGMSKLAHDIAEQGFPVFRFDRRGTGDSSGQNAEFLSSEPDIVAAAKEFRKQCPKLKKMIAFGNCDAATALALFGQKAGIEKYLLANPWVIENDQTNQSDAINANGAAIRSRYWDRLKNPRSLIDLATGKINFSKLFKGLKQASRKHENSALATRLRNTLLKLDNQVEILVAEKDTTALMFLAAWKSKDYAVLRRQSNIALTQLDSASHSFADERSANWLQNRILERIRSG